MLWKCFLPLLIVLIIGCAVLTFFSIHTIIDLHRLKTSNHLFNKRIQQLEASNNQSMASIQQWQRRIEQLEGQSNSFGFNTTASPIPHKRSGFSPVLLEGVADCAGCYRVGWKPQGRRSESTQLSYWFILRSTGQSLRRGLGNPLCATIFNGKELNKDHLTECLG